MASKFSQLSPQHQAFVVAYLDKFNATKAALKAGYGAEGAAARGSDLRKNPQVAEAITEQLDRMGISEERIKSEYAEIAFASDVADLEDVFTGEKLTELRKRGVPTKRIRKMKATRKLVKNGDDYEPVEDITIEMHDPLHALDSLARVRAMFTEKVEHSGNLTVVNVQPTLNFVPPKPPEEVIGE